MNDFSFERWSVCSMNDKYLLLVISLLEWVGEQTTGYAGVDVRDFAKSWTNGLAFCALLNKFRPDLLDFARLNAGDAERNVQLAFDGFRRIGATVYLDVIDVAGDGSFVPDEKSVWTQVAELHHFFAGRTRQSDGILRAYENDARATLAAIQAALARLRDGNYPRSAQGIRERLRAIPGNERLRIIETRARALGIWTALSMSGGHPTVASGLEPEALNAAFAGYDDAVERRRQELGGELAQAEQDIIESFDLECTVIIASCEEIASRPLRDQRAFLQVLSDRANGLESASDELAELGLTSRTEHSLPAV
jgi:actinin alpha